METHGFGCSSPFACEKWDDARDRTNFPDHAARIGNLGQFTSLKFRLTLSSAPA